MLKVRILTRLNSQYGTFEAGDIVVNLPDDVARAWVKDGVAAIPVVAAAVGPQPLPDKPEVDDLILPEEPEPVKPVAVAAKELVIITPADISDATALLGLDATAEPVAPEPVKTADTTGKKSSRKRTPATHPSEHTGPMREDPKRPA